MKITTIGVDLAKNVFQLHGVDERGHAGMRHTMKRDDMLPYFANLEPCLIGMEACGSAVSIPPSRRLDADCLPLVHHWARKLMALGHTVKLMAPQFVKPYVKSNKNDARDADAICEAVTRSNMRFVPIKNAEQQAVLSIHRAREGFVKARCQFRPTAGWMRIAYLWCTAQGNQIRGLLGEFGIIIPQGDRQRTQTRSRDT